jgi:hypothetical protein
LSAIALVDISPALASAAVGQAFVTFGQLKLYFSDRPDVSVTAVDLVTLVVVDPTVALLAAGPAVATVLLLLVQLKLADVGQAVDPLLWLRCSSC